MQGWARIKSGAEYAGLKERTFRSLLKQGLSHVRLPSGTILVKFSEIDAFLESYSVKEDEVENIVNEALIEF